MKVAIVFDTPFPGWTHEDHFARMEEDVAHWTEEHEPEQEYQVGDALREAGHEVYFIGMEDDPAFLIETLGDYPVDVVFNVTESFHGIDRLDYLVPALLETEGVRYTGASPLSLMVTRNKALSKKLLSHHGIRVPAFRAYRRREKVEKDPPIEFPAIVKPLQMDASVGISQASVVRDAEQLRERVEFVHERIGGAIVEQFIEGRELYAGVLGNGNKLEILPPTELVFDKDTKPAERIATQSAKWNEDYRERKGIKNIVARRISRAAQEQIEEVARVAYRTLWLRDFARLDLRLDADDQVWVLEANANPFLCEGHEMAKSAEKAGLKYHEFIDRIVREAKAR